MHICSCRPAEKPLDSREVVKQVAAGASTVAEVIARTGAGTDCRGCAPTLSKVKPAVRALAAERDAATGRAGEAWPTSDELQRGNSVVVKSILG